MRDEEACQSVTRSGPSVRGACVMRYLRHFSPPFLFARAFLLPPPGCQENPSYDPLSRTHRRPLVDDTESTEVRLLRRRGNPRANTVLATAGFTYVNILPCFCSALRGRAYGNWTSRTRYRPNLHTWTEKLFLLAFHEINSLRSGKSDELGDIPDVTKKLREMADIVGRVTLLQHPDRCCNYCKNEKENCIMKVISV